MKRFLIVCGLAVVLPAAAQEATTPMVGPASGTDTRAWLDLQKNPAAQVPDLRPVPGEISEQVYLRYVNSFKTAIPEKFDRESFVGK